MAGVIGYLIEYTMLRYAKRQCWFTNLVRAGYGFMSPSRVHHFLGSRLIKVSFTRLFVFYEIITLWVVTVLHITIQEKLSCHCGTRPWSTMACEEQNKKYEVLKKKTMQLAVATPLWIKWVNAGCSGGVVFSSTYPNEIFSYCVVGMTWTMAIARILSLFGKYTSSMMPIQSSLLCIYGSLTTTCTAILIFDLYCSIYCRTVFQTFIWFLASN